MRSWGAVLSLGHAEEGVYPLHRGVVIIYQILELQLQHLGAAGRALAAAQAAVKLRKFLRIRREHDGVIARPPDVFVLDEHIARVAADLEYAQLVPEVIIHAEKIVRQQELIEHDVVLLQADLVHYPGNKA